VKDWRAMSGNARSIYQPNHQLDKAQTPIGKSGLLGMIFLICLCVACYKVLQVNTAQAADMSYLVFVRFEETALFAMFIRLHLYVK